MSNPLDTAVRALWHLGATDLEFGTWNDGPLRDVVIRLQAFGKPYRAASDNLDDCATAVVKVLVAKNAGALDHPHSCEHVASLGNICIGCPCNGQCRAAWVPALARDGIDVAMRAAFALGAKRLLIESGPCGGICIAAFVGPDTINEYALDADAALVGIVRALVARRAGTEGDAFDGDSVSMGVEANDAS